MSAAHPRHHIQPTFVGHVSSTWDALVLFEACLSGSIRPTHGRPCSHERRHLIKSGNIFIYDEHTSGIKRWTDGLPWSPSRVLGNFLVYRELIAELPLRDKKRLLGRKCRRARGRRESVSCQGLSNNASSGVICSENGLDAGIEKFLTGSLTDTYDFKSDGLIKKTISIYYEGSRHHLVSYYSISDILNGQLAMPTSQPSLRGIIPRLALFDQKFREPVEDFAYKSRSPSPFDFDEYNAWQGRPHRLGWPLNVAPAPDAVSPLPNILNKRNAGQPDIFRKSQDSQSFRANYYR